MASASIPSPPALTAMSTPSPTLPTRADRDLRGPVDASAPAAWPISEQAGTAPVSGNGDTRQPTQTGTTTIVRDHAPEPAVFAPTVTADPPGGHGGGGGPAESSVQPELPAAGAGALSDMFGPGGLLNGLAGGPGDSNHGLDDGLRPPRSEDGPDHPGRGDRPGTRRADGPGNAGGAGRGFGSHGNSSDGGGGNRGSDGHTGGGQHRGGGSRR